MFYSKSAAAWRINAAGEMLNFGNKRKKDPFCFEGIQKRLQNFGNSTEKNEFDFQEIRVECYHSRQSCMTEVSK